MDLAICFILFILAGIMVNIGNVTKELTKIRKLLEEKEEQLWHGQQYQNKVENLSQCVNQ